MINISKLSNECVMMLWMKQNNNARWNEINKNLEIYNA